MNNILIIFLKKLEACATFYFILIERNNCIFIKINIILGLKISQFFQNILKQAFYNVARQIQICRKILIFFLNFLTKLFNDK